MAKICFWLIENKFTVLIAACDTFRAGAVEQLRTHTRRLNSLHPPDNNHGEQMVQLYEKGETLWRIIKILSCELQAMGRMLLA